MNPNNAVLALDVLQNNVPPPSAISDLSVQPDGESHPGTWNLLRFDGSVQRVVSNSLSNPNSVLYRQNHNQVLGQGSNAWSEYETELKMLMNAK